MTDRRIPDWAMRAWERFTLYGLIALGSVIGGLSRYLVGVAQLALVGPPFPWAILFVNVTGSFIIGFYATLTGPDGRIFAGTRQRQFVMTGICGGYTTFSGFSLDTLQLIHHGHRAAALANVAASPVAWLIAVWVGYAVATRLNRLRTVAATGAEAENLQIPRHATLLRIFVDESDQHDGMPLYEAIVLKAREMQLAGATVFRGPAGYGQSSQMHLANALGVPDTLPLIIEIIDGEDAVSRFLPALDEMMPGGMVTMEKVEVLQYGRPAGR
ncbi:camphor resistance protein CrcB [Rhodopseudomonas palustris HaA2]|uniref:Fluoride-specific ion channel FluC n=2 Tax=Rhodopseudomonas palustris TaxID=1076 RepID=Q2IVW0_RHOP2|nr:camphor resistance protein CrcB [Rhodopseudomonas palustris HaA2]